MDGFQIGSDVAIFDLISKQEKVILSNGLPNAIYGWNDDMVLVETFNQGFSEYLDLKLVGIDGQIYKDQKYDGIYATEHQRKVSPDKKWVYFESRYGVELISLANGDSGVVGFATKSPEWSIDGLKVKRDKTEHSINITNDVPKSLTKDGKAADFHMKKNINASK